MGQFGMPGRRCLRKGGAQRTHHIHVFQYDNTVDILRHLAFRDYLRCHPEACRRYGNTKVALAAAHPHDTNAYQDGKDALVKEIERDALQWHWETYQRN